MQFHDDVRLALARVEVNLLHFGNRHVVQVLHELKFFLRLLLVFFIGVSDQLDRKFFSGFFANALFDDRRTSLAQVALHVQLVLVLKRPGL